MGLLRGMAKTQVPFEQTLFDLYRLSLFPEQGPETAQTLTQAPKNTPAGEPAYSDPELNQIIKQICALPLDPAINSETARKHAYFQGSRPCTMLIDEVESLWEAIALKDDWDPFHAKMAEIAQMREAYGFQASIWPD